jgi:lipoprotein-anchoring transpeptidase ErfK/SrfK
MKQPDCPCHHSSEIINEEKAMSMSTRIIRVAIILVVLVLGPGAAFASPHDASGTYVVRRGDTLAVIAARTGVSLSTLVRANGIANPNLIYVGQRLLIPGRGASGAAQSSTAAKAAPVATGTYIVHRGDTLSRIAARYGTSVSALVRLNGLASPDRIWVGQRLRVSGKAAPVAGPAPKAGSAPTGGKWIDINLSRQRLTAYVGNRAVFSALISGGTRAHPTVVGRFKVRTKLGRQTMSGPGYYLPNVPSVMYFYAGYAIHGTYWHNNFGHPMSHGCVNMRTGDAAWLYKWTPIGTPVVTHW